MNKNYLSDILYIIAAIALIALVIIFIYFLAAYANKPLSELPTWAWFIFSRRR